MGLRPNFNWLGPRAPSPLSPVEQSENRGLLSGSFVGSCDMTQLGRNVTGVPP